MILHNPRKLAGDTAGDTFQLYNLPRYPAPDVYRQYLDLEQWPEVKPPVGRLPRLATEAERDENERLDALLTARNAQEGYATTTAVTDLALAQVTARFDMRCALAFLTGGPLPDADALYGHGSPSNPYSLRHAQLVQMLGLRAAGYRGQLCSYGDYLYVTDGAFPNPLDRRPWRVVSVEKGWPAPDMEPTGYFAEGQFVV